MRIPLITEIQRFSLQDGPGIRTTVFVKGCPLRCPWCHNPETQSPKKEFYYYRARCTVCGRCAAVCPAGASTIVGEGRLARLEFDRDKCIGCMTCVANCLAEARSAVGQDMKLEEVLAEVLSDRAFYKNSGGGVTISGGDPLMYAEFTRQLATRLQGEGVHVAIETSCFPKEWHVIEPLLTCVDLFIVDLKTLDAEKHERVVGWPLAPIIENIGRLIECGARVRIHIPVIPGFNDSEEDFHRFVRFFADCADRVDGVDVLNYHCYAEGKYEYLGRSGTYQYKGVAENPPDKSRLLALALKEIGIASVTVGGLVGVATGCGGRNRVDECA